MGVGNQESYAIPQGLLGPITTPKSYGVNRGVVLAPGAGSVMCPAGGDAVSLWGPPEQDQASFSFPQTLRAPIGQT